MTAATTPSQVPPPLDGVRPREWAHVVIRTAQPDALIAWYCQVLNAQPVLRHPLISFITWDGSQDRMAFMTDKSPPQGSRVDHFAVTYGSPADLAANYRRLAEAGVLPRACVNHGVAASYYYSDPDGNQLETSVENFASTVSLNAWLATGAFDENPYGVQVDPETLARRLEAVPAGEWLGPDAEHRTWLRDNMAKVLADHDGEKSK